MYGDLVEFSTFTIVSLFLGLAAALPSTPLEKRACSVPPASACTVISSASCEYCCRTDPSRTNPQCHAHDANPATPAVDYIFCTNGGSGVKYHCDSH
ncbi:hypothetical protein BJ508DRAFT_359440 [Ascobolus immersus RN42]|uniref:Uncharacterized protein n=1 Tax=Ascobolus immersus RN42 TaxID=1160509 RepID=A0A3N4IH12_ASCIM|nr:hypothetical protein BJ508DRAFT_359440 [Ascobolus immersus RN42]